MRRNVWRPFGPLGTAIRPSIHTTQAQSRHQEADMPTDSKLETPEELFAEAMRLEEQAKAEQDPRLIAHCLRERDWFLNEAAKLEANYG